MTIHGKYHDGNIPYGWRQLGNIKESLVLLPGNVTGVRLRTEGCGERFGVIEFVISSPIIQEFKDAVKRTGEREWRALILEDGSELGKECAEINSVPNRLSFSKKVPNIVSSPSAISCAAASTWKPPR